MSAYTQVIRWDYVTTLVNKRVPVHPRSGNAILHPCRHLFPPREIARTPEAIQSQFHAVVRTTTDDLTAHKIINHRASLHPVVRNSVITLLSEGRKLCPHNRPHGKNAQMHAMDLRCSHRQDGYDLYRYQLEGNGWWTCGLTARSPRWLNSSTPPVRRT